MTSTPDSIEQLGGSLHYDPAAYWCPKCWAFTLDCVRLVPHLQTRLVPVKDWLLTGVRYDRTRRILEVHTHTGEAYQGKGVSLELALLLIRAEAIGKFYQDRISGKF